MPTPAALAATAALLGDPARAAMLSALMAGEALTAGELARVAGIGAPAASAHLARLVDGGLLAVHAQGRHRYHRLASPEVAQAIEAIGGLSEAIAPARRWPHGEAFREARLCWDHLAGRLGVAVHAGLVARAWLQPAIGGLSEAIAPARRWPHGEAFREARLCWDHLAGRLGVDVHAGLVARAWLEPAIGGWATTPAGIAGLTGLGVDLAATGTARRFACDCMDWSERRPHLAGGLGREIARTCLAQYWVVRTAAASADDPLGRRRLAVTPEGRRRLGVLLDDAVAHPRAPVAA